MYSCVVITFSCNFFFQFKIPAIEKGKDVRQSQPKKQKMVGLSVYTNPRTNAKVECLLKLKTCPFLCSLEHMVQDIEPTRQKE